MEVNFKLKGPDELGYWSVKSDVPQFNGLLGKLDEVLENVAAELGHIAEKPEPKPKKAKAKK